MLVKRKTTSTAHLDALQAQLVRDSLRAVRRVSERIGEVRGIDLGAHAAGMRDRALDRPVAKGQSTPRDSALREAVKLVTSRCTEIESGGHMIDATLTKRVSPIISRDLPTHMIERNPLHKMQIGMADSRLRLYVRVEPGVRVHSP
jgi:hypothetical protein